MSRLCVHVGKADEVKQALVAIDAALEDVDPVFKTEPTTQKVDWLGRRLYLTFEAPTWIHYELCPSFGLTLVEDLS